LERPLSNEAEKWMLDDWAALESLAARIKMLPTRLSKRFVISLTSITAHDYNLMSEMFDTQLQ
jgi:hypothetical protein